ncbi:lytic transglycosylase domain-containing protein [Nocardiopsis lambiniae]|uniref:Lytic transglycosylase domain-containing protein n=1 Tax=Nocardiopsis lambiniae TaxID=3075539 RepID=A0ABU2M8S6_9ACTN|nr:lytic transglycosylase domain-containing protein [Nocardiopsis sp. DSM 44743]MDT0329073.1 lytic transglycosylase domain-containing protein [Nocardiopsis sp. DSM 44743]
MGGGTRGTKRGKGPLIAVCATLALCLLLTGGVLFVVDRLSRTLDAWQVPPETAAGPLDGTIETPAHDGLTGPPTPAEVDPATGAEESLAAGADERSTPDGAADRRPADEWLEQVSTATSVPPRALEGYAGAQLALAAELPSCNLSWPTLAGIGFVESRHGTYAGGEIGPDGTTTVDIIGIPLDGTNNTQAIPDTDGGLLDGDAEWDRAIGPMQFIPSTWARWGVSVSGGDPDPHQIDDAALSAGRYLCAGGRDLTVAADWEAAILSYNRSSEYVADVLAYAHAYADAAA